MSLHFILFGLSSLLYLFLRGSVYLVLAISVYQNLSLPAIRILMLTTKAAAHAIALWFALSFQGVGALAVLLITILALGIELADHAKKRTTAAYSTSDSQSQRLFNLSVFTLIFTSLLVVLGHLIGISPIPHDWTKGIVDSFESPFLWIIPILGCLILLRFCVLTIKHARILLYIASSYWRAIRRGKMKRIW